jgi:hypothetical protein
MEVVIATGVTSSITIQITIVTIAAEVIFLITTITTAAVIISSAIITEEI